MRILGFDIRRTAPAEKRSFFDAFSSWRSAFNFSAASGPGHGIVNPWDAMGVPAVFACVSKIAKTNASCPRYVYDVTDPHNARRVTTTPAALLLAGKANAYQTSQNFWHLATARQPLWGNFYAEIQRDRKTGEAVALWPLLNNDCIPELKAGKKVFRVGGQELADDDVLHLMEPGFNGLWGVSRIAMHRASIGAAVEMQAFTEALYRNGLKPAGAFTLPAGAALDAEAFARLRETIDERYIGAGNGGRPLLLEEGMTFSPLAMPLEDAEFVASKRFTIAEIARVFDMPLHKLQEMDGAKFNNIEQQNLSFVIDTIEPINIGQAQECTKLFAPHDRGRLEVRISTDHLLRGDMVARLTALATARQWDILNRNEARRALGYNDIGPEGDRFGIPGNANAPAPAQPDTKPADPATTPPTEPTGE
jgi:HK97 family phage portal protein